VRVHVAGARAEVCVGDGGVSPLGVHVVLHCGCSRFACSSLVDLLTCESRSFSSSQICHLCMFHMTNMALGLCTRIFL
jgi:hypothetical protein